MSNTYPPLVSVIIATYRPNPDFIREALYSAVGQTLRNDLYEIIVVDDASDDDEALGALHEVEAASEAQSIKFHFEKHAQNQWLAAARTTGATLSQAPYVVFLDDDDLLAEDYLEKCLLLLMASPRCDWVYTSHRKFGQRNQVRHADDFSPFKFAFRNNMSYSSMFRRKVWLEVGQREQLVTASVRQFEDWDMYVRLIAKGRLGTPLRDTMFNYRKSSAGLAARSIREYILSVYKMYRTHALKIPLLLVPSLKNRRRKRQGHSRASIFNPVWPINKLLRVALAKFAGAPDLPSALDLRTAVLAIFRPKLFAHDVISNKELLSLAALRSGFDGQVDYSFTQSRNFPSQPANKTILAGHIWWQMGGAELIYWYWLKSAKRAGCDKLLNLVSYDDLKSSVLKFDFGEISDTQYNLSAFGETPEERLKATWNLIDLERPKVIFISSNSYLYQLTPHIKREFPWIKIVDILHNEYDGLVDWYTISYDYSEYIDKRIVTSEYWKQVLIKKYHVAPEKIVVARNPVDTELYDPKKYDRAKLLESRKIKPNKIVISFIGRLHPQKGLDVFLQLAEAMSSDEKFHFVIVGDGEQLDVVRDTLKTARNLSFLGYFRSVETVLAMTDILVCPSLYEGAPLIGLEAAAMNTAVIAPNLVGFKEQIEEGGFGKLYDASMEVQRDAQHIKVLLQDSAEQLIERGQNGRAFIMQHHAYSVVTKHYEAEIAELLENDSTEPPQDD